MIAAIAAVVIYAGFTIYGKATETEAAELSSSVELAENHADNMGRALNDVSMFASQSDPVLEQQQTGSPATGRAQPDSPPRGQQQTSIPSVAGTLDIQTLLARWEPRYEGAKLAYIKLESAISAAKTSAAGYFDAQRAITERINDPGAKMRAEQDDGRDWELYQKWAERADSVLAEAYAIGLRLDDMDAGLRKLELRAGFAFDASSFSEVPAAIADLNRDLADFQVASENIRAVTKSPFEE